MCWITALFCFQDDVHVTRNSTSATDGLSSSSFIEYPKHKPFINADLERSPWKPVIPYPESNSRGNSSAKLVSYLFPNHGGILYVFHIYEGCSLFILLSIPSDVQVACFVGPLHFSFQRTPDDKGHLTDGERCSSLEIENYKIVWVLCEIVLTCFLCPFFSLPLLQPFSWIHSWVRNRETLVPRMVWSKGIGLVLLKLECLSWMKGVLWVFILSVKA